MSSSQHDARDVAAVGRIEAVPSILKVLCQVTGMGFAAVAQVTEGAWIACAVEDEIGFGLRPGSALDIDTTLCKEVRQAVSPIAIDHASRDPSTRPTARPSSTGSRATSRCRSCCPAATTSATCARSIRSRQR